MIIFNHCVYDARSKAQESSVHLMYRTEVKFLMKRDIYTEIKLIKVLHNEELNFKVTRTLGMIHTVESKRNIFLS